MRVSGEERWLNAPKLFKKFVQNGHYLTISLHTVYYSIFICYRLYLVPIKLKDRLSINLILMELDAEKGIAYCKKGRQSLWLESKNGFDYYN